MEKSLEKSLNFLPNFYVNPVEATHFFLARNGILYERTVLKYLPPL